jgi:uncharacterized protein YpmS
MRVSVSPDVDREGTLIALSVLTFALCRLTLPFSGVLCAITTVVCLLAFVVPLSFVLGVAVGTER